MLFLVSQITKSVSLCGVTKSILLVYSTHQPGENNLAYSALSSAVSSAVSVPCRNSADRCELRPATDPMRTSLPR